MTAKSKSDLLREYTPFSLMVASKSSRGHPSWRFDEIRQSALLGLWNAIERYDPGQGANLKTYAAIRMRGEIGDEIRKNMLLGRTAHTKRGVQVIHDETEDGSFLDREYHEDYEEQILIEKILKIIAELPIKYQTALTEFINGDGYIKSGATEVLGVSESRVSQLKREAVEMIRKRLRIRV